METSADEQRSIRLVYLRGRIRCLAGNASVTPIPPDGRRRFAASGVVPPSPAVEVLARGQAVGTSEGNASDHPLLAALHALVSFFPGQSHISVGLPQHRSVTGPG